MPAVTKPGGDQAQRLSDGLVVAVWELPFGQVLIAFVGVEERESSRLPLASWGGRAAIS